jgi:hypothetical protein
MPYMNVTEVESALIGLAAAHPSICELITLPNPTIEGRTTRAVRLGTQPANTVDAYYLTGGVHAREWGSCEILVNLATDLCDAYAARPATPIRSPGRRRKAPSRQVRQPGCGECENWPRPRPSPATRPDRSTTRRARPFRRRRSTISTGPTVISSAPPPASGASLHR